MELRRRGKATKSQPLRVPARCENHQGRQREDGRVDARVTVGVQSGVMKLTSRTLTIGVIGALLGVAACGGSDGGDAATFDAADFDPAAAVCNGTPNPSAPNGTGRAEMGYAYLNDGDGWRTTWGSVFGANHATIAETEATSILCATIVESTEAERCDFEDEGDTFTLIKMAATYDIELRFASSGNVIGKDTVSAPAEECPMITSWSKGETERRSWPEPTAELARTLDVFFPDR